MSGRLATALAALSMGLFQAFRMTDEELLALEGVGQAMLEEIRVIQMGNSLFAAVIRCG